MTPEEARAMVLAWALTSYDPILPPIHWTDDTSTYTRGHTNKLCLCGAMSQNCNFESVGPRYNWCIQCVVLKPEILLP